MNSWLCGNTLCVATLRRLFFRTYQAALLVIVTTMALAYWLLSSGETRWKAEAITHFGNVRGEALVLATAEVRNQNYFELLASLPVTRATFLSDDKRLLVEQIRSHVDVNIVEKSIVVRVTGYDREATTKLAKLVMDDVMGHMQPRPSLIQLRRELIMHESRRLNIAGGHNNQYFLVNMAKKEALVEYYRRRLAIYENYLEGHDAGAILARLDFNGALNNLALDYGNHRLYPIFRAHDVLHQLNRIRLYEMVRLFEENQDKLAALVEMGVINRQPTAVHKDASSIWHRILLWGLFSVMLWIISMTLFALKRDKDDDVETR